MRRYFEAVSWNTANDHVADGQTLLDRPAFQIARLVLDLLQPRASAKHLNAGDIDAVDFCTIVGEQSGEWTAYDLAPVDHSNALAEQPFAVVEEVVVDLQVLQDLHNSEWGAWQNRFPGVVGRVQEADVLVHVANELGRQAFNVFVHADSPLEGLIPPGVEDRIVDNHTIDFRICVCLTDLVLQVLAFNLA